MLKIHKLRQVLLLLLRLGFCLTLLL